MTVSGTSTAHADRLGILPGAPALSLTQLFPGARFLQGALWSRPLWQLKSHPLPLSPSGLMIYIPACAFPEMCSEVSLISFLPEGEGQGSLWRVLWALLGKIQVSSLFLTPPTKDMNQTRIKGSSGRGEGLLLRRNEPSCGECLSRIGSRNLWCPQQQTLEWQDCSVDFSFNLLSPSW